MRKLKEAYDKLQKEKVTKKQMFDIIIEGMALGVGIAGAFVIKAGVNKFPNYQIEIGTHEFYFTLGLAMITICFFIINTNRNFKWRDDEK